MLPRGLRGAPRGEPLPLRVAGLPGRALPHQALPGAPRRPCLTPCAASLPRSICRAPSTRALPEKPARMQRSITSSPSSATASWTSPSRPVSPGERPALPRVAGVATSPPSAATLSRWGGPSGWPAGTRLWRFSLSSPFFPLTFYIVHFRDAGAGKASTRGFNQLELDPERGAAPFLALGHGHSCRGGENLQQLYLLLVMCLVISACPAFQKCGGGISGSLPGG